MQEFRKESKKSKSKVSNRQTRTVLSENRGAGVKASPLKGP